MLMDNSFCSMRGAGNMINRVKNSKFTKSKWSSLHDLGMFADLQLGIKYINSHDYFVVCASAEEMFCKSTYINISIYKETINNKK